jgi:ribonuclease E
VEDDANATGNSPVAAKKPRRRRRRRGRGRSAASGAKPGGPHGAGKIVLMNAADPGEARVAILCGGRIEEVYLERSGRSLAGNIYRGTVTNVEPSLQAAFVDIGHERNGFLHASDCVPPDGGFSELLAERRRRARGAAKRGHHGHAPIENMLRKGQDVLVQVTKDGIGTKGPALTTYLSLPGRYLVLMPGLKRLGVSKKIEEESHREQLRAMLGELSPPKELGFIARTASVGHPLEDMRRDMEFLVGLWQALLKRAREATSPALIYQESDLVIRAARDFLPADTELIVADSEQVLERVREFLDLVCPEMLDRTALHQGPQPLFHEYGVEEELAKLGRRRVRLPAGGSLVIEQTEALVAIDVNTGSYRGRRDQAGAILQTNLEAAREVAQQLRLRDIGGLIIIDFIDMDSPAHCRQVEKELRDALERDRARIFVTPMSQLGVVEMSRQRTRPGLAVSTFMSCPTCHGTGTVKSAESLGLDLLREAKAAIGRGNCAEVEALFAPDIAVETENRYRADLVRLEESSGVRIIVSADPGLRPGQMRLVVRGESGSQVSERTYEEAD